tara:strand:- start:5626 stop:6135 length:510 start_codon:yes stop_codon:yes gene_type:complete
MPLEQIEFTVNDQVISLAYRRQRDGKFKVVRDDQAVMLTIHEAGRGAVDIEVNGQRLRFAIEPHQDSWLVHSERGDLLLRESPRYPNPNALEADSGLTAPMPGAVLAAEVAPGDTVNKGDLLVILEAMKMEHRIVAPRDGTVERVHVAVGDQVDNAQLLITLAEEGVED